MDKRAAFNKKTIGYYKHYLSILLPLVQSNLGHLYKTVNEKYNTMILIQEDQLLIK